jgi:hypothetical protein
MTFMGRIPGMTLSPHTRKSEAEAVEIAQLISTPSAETIVKKTPLQAFKDSKVICLCTGRLKDITTYRTVRSAERLTRKIMSGATYEGYLQDDDGYIVPMIGGVNELHQRISISRFSLFTCKGLEF